jgi:peptidoglycan/LPS O-acetylase OafA/YrhL
MLFYRNFFDLSHCETLDARLIATQNRPSGFDYMRLALAMGVVFFHGFVSSYGLDETRTGFGVFFALFALILPMFFSLSGFLVAGSLERSKTLVTFLGLRAIRILPALSVEIFISALLLGPLLSTFALHDYFTGPEFIAYFKNIVGIIQYHLPGVFLNIPDAGKVNGQLWTIPPELNCYELIALLAILGIFKRRWVLLFFFSLVCAHQIRNAIVIHEAAKMAGVLKEHDLVRSFLAGVVVYRFRDKIPYNKALFALALCASLACLRDVTAQRFAFIPAAYVMVYLGLMNPPKNRILQSGDYSYGLYLYSSAIQQAVAAISPALQHWYWNLLIGMPCALAAAVGSWWLVEKPALGLRNRLKSLESWCLEQTGKIRFSSSIVSPEEPPDPA